MIDFCKIIYTGKVSEILAIRKALDYLPNAVIELLKDELTIFTMTNKAATRLSRPLCKTKEIIFISNCIFPTLGEQAKTEFRFFAFVLLHEIAHAYLKHKCQVFDGISQDEVDRQESEADSLARQWYNDYVEAHHELEINSITIEEMAAFRNDLSLILSK